MVDGLTLEPGERIIFQSTLGGPAGYSGWMWLGILFGGSQLCGLLIWVPLMISGESSRSGSGNPSQYIMSALTLLICGAALVRWILMRTKLAYFITDKRLIARRLLLTPVAIDLDNVASAARVLVQYTRYGRVTNELLTHRVAVAFHSGGYRRFGPIKDADEFVSLLQGVAQRSIDCKALPDIHGGPPLAEVRSDLFFARTTKTAGAQRGPIFVGPTKVIGFAEPFFGMLLNQALTIAGASRSPHEIEEQMLAMAQSSSFGKGRAVIMEREGLDLVVEGQQLKLTSGDQAVVFELEAEDAVRAAKSYKSRGYR